MKPFAAIIILAGLAPAPLHAGFDDGKAAGAANPQSHSDANEQTKNSTAASSPDALQRILRDALKLVAQAVEPQLPKAPGAALPGLPLGPVSPFDDSRVPREAHAEALRAIGRAQAKLGDLAGARSTLQSALEIIPQMQSYGGPIEQAAQYVEIARAQLEARDPNEVRFTVRQALQSARAIKQESPDFFLAPAPDVVLSNAPGAVFANDPLVRKVGLLCRIARIQAETGETAASQQSVQLAEETATSIDDVPKKLFALLEFARNCPTDQGKDVWARALDLALGVKDEYPRAKCVEMILRARIQALLVDQAVATVADRLKGDLQNFAIWVVADAVASGEQAVAPAAMNRLAELARKAEFDRPSKKINVFKRIAEAQARLGDFEGAYRNAGEPHPINDVQNFRATQARLSVMKSIAEAQLKTKKLAAARDTVQVALELVGALPDEEIEAYFPLQELGSIQARCGDPSGAEQTVNALTSIPWRIHILCEIAQAHAQAGRNDLARKMIQRALDDARRAPNAAVWARTESSSPAPDAEFDIEPLLPVLQTIAVGQARIGDLDVALKTVKDMGKSSFSQWSKAAALKQIAELRIERGDFPGALKAADLLADFDSFNTSKSELLEDIARKQAEQAEPAAVLQWVAKENAPDAKLRALEGLADGIIARVTKSGLKPAGSLKDTKSAQ